jgi:hypothetical protein
VLEWIADKILFRIDRNEAVAIPCNVDEPVLLVSGVWSNRRGEPIAGAWLAATVEDGLVTFEDMFHALRTAGIANDMINPHWQGELDHVESAAEAVVNAATARLADTVADALEVTWERLGETRNRLERWQAEARALADGIKSDPHRVRRLEHIGRVTRQIQGLIDDHTPADAPLIRIVGALVPRN